MAVATGAPGHSIQKNEHMQFFGIIPLAIGEGSVPPAAPVDSHHVITFEIRFRNRHRRPYIFLPALRALFEGRWVMGQFESPSSAPQGRHWRR